MMENVYKMKIKLENIWIDLIRGIYAPYILNSVKDNIPLNRYFVRVWPINSVTVALA